MGSEMCIRDRAEVSAQLSRIDEAIAAAKIDPDTVRAAVALYDSCLLYTSDAADERSSVDLGGRRIIKKKKSIELKSAH